MPSPTLVGELKKHLNDERDEEEKDDREMCVSISLSLGEAQGAWKLHPYNSVTKKLFFTCPI